MIEILAKYILIAVDIFEFTSMYILALLASATLDWERLEDCRDAL